MDQRSRRAPRQYPGSAQAVIGEANDPPSRPNSTLNPGHVSQPTADPNESATTDFQAIGPALRVIQLNVEGLSAAKREVIRDLANRHKADIICLQETHVAVQTAGRYNIEGFDLISSTPDAKYGRATYARSESVEATSLSTSSFCDVIQVGGFKIANVYKPPSAHWGPEMLPILEHPAIFTGDFNSHHTDWNYADSDEDGEMLVE